MRILFGIVAGLVAAFACIYAIELACMQLYPPPAGMDYSDPAAVERMMAQIPVAALAIVAFAWFVGALVGGWIANAIAARAWAGWIIAALLVAGAVATMVMIPHPAWMWVAGVAAPLLGGWLAQRLARTRTANPIMS